MVNSLEDTQTGELLGVTKIGISLTKLYENINFGNNLLNSQSLQIINGEDSSILYSFSKDSTTNQQKIIGGATVGQVIQKFLEALNRNNNPTEENMTPFLAA